MGHKKIIRIDPMSMALPPGGVDSHAHLDSSEFDNDRPQVLERAKNVGLTGIGNVFMGPDEYHTRKKYFANAPEVFFLLGIHPCDGLKCSPDCLARIEDCFNHDSRIRALGEIGLDYHWDDCPRELQLQAFSRQMELAKKMDVPVVIHCREAEADCLTLLEAGGFPGYPLLWHCFGGAPDLARRIIRNGWSISIPGAVTYKNNDQSRQAAGMIPPDKLLLETDCPYLSPVPWRGTRNEPAYTVFTARAVAGARNEEPAELWLKCGENARKFFGIL